MGTELGSALLNVGAGIASAPINVVATATTPPAETPVAPATEPKPVEQAPPPQQVEPPAVPNETIVASNNIDITTTPIPKEESKADGASKETTQSTEAKTEKKPITGLLATVAGLSEPTKTPTKDKSLSSTIRQSETEESPTTDILATLGVPNPLTLGDDSIFKKAGFYFKNPSAVIDLAVGLVKRKNITDFTPVEDNPNFVRDAKRFSEKVLDSTEKVVKTDSTAYLYKQWDMKQEGKTLIITKADGTDVRIEKNSEEEASFVKETLRPTGVTSYETKQARNGNCVPLSRLQHIVLTGERMDEIAKSMHYNSEKKELAISLVDNNTFETKNYIFNQAQIDRGKTDRYNNTIAESKTHQDFITAWDLALRQHAEANNPDLKGNSPLNPKNIEPSRFTDLGKVQAALNPYGKTQKIYGSNEKGEIVEDISFNQRLSLEQIDSIQKNSRGGNVMLAVTVGGDQKKERIIKNAGIVPTHAYTLISVDLEKRTAKIINPWNSSEVLEITDATDFFNIASVENI